MLDDKIISQAPKIIETTTPLGAGGEFTSQIIPIQGYREMVFMTRSDVAAAPNGLVVRQGVVETTIDDLVNQFSPLAGATMTNTVTLFGNYAQIVYTNGGAIQGEFRFVAKFFAL